MKIFGLVLILLGVIIFWFCFWVAAPYVQSLIPISQWKGLIDLIIYILIAWAGGVGLPLALIFQGAFITAVSE